MFHLRKWFLRRWRRVFSPDEVVSPLLGGNGELDIAIYQSTSLTNEHGRSPEKAVARYLAENLDRAGIGYEISFEYSPKYVNPEYEESNPPGKILGEDWVESHREHTASDANLLLLNINGGGVSYLRGKYGVAPAGNIDYVPEFVESHDGATHRNIRASLHEVGHMLGGKHKDNMFTPPSMVFNGSVVDDFHEYVNRNV